MHAPVHAPVATSFASPSGMLHSPAPRQPPSVVHAGTSVDPSPPPHSSATPALVARANIMSVSSLTGGSDREPPSAAAWSSMFSSASHLPPSHRIAAGGVNGYSSMPAPSASPHMPQLLRRSTDDEPRSPDRPRSGTSHSVPASSPRHHGTSREASSHTANTSRKRRVDEEQVPPSSMITAPAPHGSMHAPQDWYPAGPSPYLPQAQQHQSHSSSHHHQPGHRSHHAPPTYPPRSASQSSNLGTSDWEDDRRRLVEREENTQSGYIPNGLTREASQSQPPGHAYPSATGATAQNQWKGGYGGYGNTKPWNPSLNNEAKEWIPPKYPNGALRDHFINDGHTTSEPSPTNERRTVSSGGNKPSSRSHQYHPSPQYGSQPIVNAAREPTHWGGTSPWTSSPEIVPGYPDPASAQMQPSNTAAKSRHPHPTTGPREPPPPSAAWPVVGSWATGPTDRQSSVPDARTNKGVTPTPSYEPVPYADGTIPQTRAGWKLEDAVSRSKGQQPTLHEPSGLVSPVLPAWDESHVHLGPSSKQAQLVPSAIAGYVHPSPVPVSSAKRRKTEKSVSSALTDVNGRFNTTANRISPPPKIVLSALSREEIAKESRQPSLLEVDSSRVTRVLDRGLEPRSFAGRVCWNPLQTPTKLLPIELLQHNVGAQIEVLIDTRWLRGVTWSVGSPQQESRPWMKSCDDENCNFDDGQVKSLGSLMKFRGNQDTEIWGTEVYSDDSDVLTMAIHSGWLRIKGAELTTWDREDGQNVAIASKSDAVGRDIVTNYDLDTEVVNEAPSGSTLKVTLLIAPKLVRYQGSLRGGVLSKSWGNSHDGMSLMIEKIELTNIKLLPRGRHFVKKRVSEYASALKIELDQALTSSVVAC